MTAMDMPFAWIPPGDFEMGSDSNNNEKPRHKVIIKKGFWMARTPVTQAQWKSVMGFNPSHFSTAGDAGKCPVESVSWLECQTFCKHLTDLTGKPIRLPTEAEWEYACRATTQSDYYSGSNEKALGEVGWYTANSGQTTKPVMLKLPNRWGLFDMHGNVWEWCQDWYGDYPATAQTDPTGPGNGSSRVFRGGAWNYSADDCRAACRGNNAPDNRGNGLGLRVCFRQD